MSQDNSVELPKVGDIVAGKYRIERVLGRGGMGVVVAATHTKLGQKVAIKFVTVEASESMLRRFEREGRAVARLKGEHVTRVHDVGELDDGTPFMVMEYLEGQDLAAVVKERGALPVEEAVDYMLQACEAVAEAHAAGLIHRDLKPANLFLSATPDGSAIVKVLDFGISKDTNAELLATGEEDLTKTSTLLGTPHYMAPEQMRSARDVDTRADIWSLGAILYQLLTSQRPFVAASLAELLVKVLQEEPPPPSQRRPGEVPIELEAVLRRCMRKEPDERWANVAQLAEALVPFGPEWGRDAATRCARLLGVTPSSTSLPPRSRGALRAPSSNAPAPHANDETLSAAETIPSHPPSSSAPPPSLGDATAPSRIDEAAIARTAEAPIPLSQRKPSVELASPSDAKALERGDTAAAVTATASAAAPKSKAVVALAGALAIAVLVFVGISLRHDDRSDASEPADSTAGAASPSPELTRDDPLQNPSAGDPGDEPEATPSETESVAPAPNSDRAAPKPEPTKPEPPKPEPPKPEPPKPELPKPEPPKPEPPKPSPEPPKPTVEPAAPKPQPPSKNPLDMDLK